MIWSDEALIRIGHDSRRRRVIRPIGKGLQKPYVQPTFKSNQVTIMVWAWFCADRIGPILTLARGGIGAVEYMKILYDGLLSMIDDLLGEPVDPDTIRVANENSLLFMHDNAPCYKDHRVGDLLQKHSIPVMCWPPQSPDLNPIENLWPGLKHHFHKRFLELGLCPSTNVAAIEKYCRMIRESWTEVDRKLLQRLIESMPGRVAAVIAANGGSTKY